MNLCKRIGYHMQQLTQLEGELEELRQQVSGAGEKDLPALRRKYQAAQNRAQEIQETIQGLHWNVPEICSRRLGFEQFVSDRFKLNKDGYIERIAFQRHLADTVPEAVKEQLESGAFFQFLPQLKEIKLSYWKGSEVPAGFLKAEQIEKLTLDDAHITHLSGKLLRALKNLKNLSISGMRHLRALPPEIGEKKELQRLSFSSCDRRFRNQEVQIPASVWQLPRLTRLCLQYPKGPIDPQKIGKMPHLTELNLQGATFVRTTETIWSKFPHLSTLALKDVRFEERAGEGFTRGLSQLKALKSLTWEYNRFHEGDLVEMASLESLTELRLIENEINGEFPSLGNLSSLQLLVLSKSTFEGFPEGVLEAPVLEELWMDNTGITSLPPDIAELHKLKILDVGGNPFRVVPSSIGNMQSLTRLTLFETKVAHLSQPIIKLSERQGGQNANIDIKNTPMANNPPKWEAFKAKYPPAKYNISST